MMRNVGRAHPNNVYNNGQKFDKRNPTLTRINEERFAYAMTSLVVGIKLRISQYFVFRARM